MKSYATRHKYFVSSGTCAPGQSRREVGLGLSLDQTELKARVIERYFVPLPDSLATFQEWRRLVVNHSVTGVAVHDAKLVASMNVYGLVDSR